MRSPFACLETAKFSPNVFSTSFPAFPFNIDHCLMQHAFLFTYFAYYPTRPYSVRERIFVWFVPCTSQQLEQCSINICSMNGQKSFRFCPVCCFYWLVHNVLCLCGFRLLIVSLPLARHFPACENHMVTSFPSILHLYLSVRQLGRVAR